MTDPMKRMKPLLLLTDIGFILYWSLSLVILAGFQVVPPEWMFKDYENPLINAWNWSFFPLDMVLSVCGLLAVRLHAKGNSAWVSLAGFSLALTFCAGFMAVSFWAIRGDFDPVWWGMNLFLMVWPLFFVFKLRQETV